MSPPRCLWVRLVAQIGAAIGREFPYALLCVVSRLPADELQTALTRLVASELVFQRGTPPDAVYTFKHALVQDAAHGSLLLDGFDWHEAHVGADHCLADPLGVGRIVFVGLDER